MSEMLHGSVDVFAPLPSEGREWDVQVPGEIIREAKQLVLERRCQVDDLDDEATLDRFWLNQIDEGRMRVRMPNNRMLSADAFLCRSVRDDLHGESSDNGLVQTSPTSRHSPQQPRRPRNPWYLPPATWYSEATGRSTAGRHAARSSRRSGRISGPANSGPNSHRTSPEHEDRPRALTESDKATLRIVEAYRQSLKGQRLPHFLQ